MTKQKKLPQKKRDSWSSRLGVILAVAGSAVGLGNFLRFPGQALFNGGGAFLIPYFIALFLVGIPLMWIEWTAGRYGGIFGHGTAPGIFHSLWKNRFIKYFGIIGIFGPIVIFIYYLYIESWLLAYSFFSLTGSLFQSDSAKIFNDYLNGGVISNGWRLLTSSAFIFLFLTFLFNIRVIFKGISGGIEKLSRIAMPLLALLGIILAVRILTLGTPDPALPQNSVWNGLGYLWNPNWSMLKDAKVWLAATGQIFFTLSVGIGVILTYASYLKRDEDIALSGVTSVFTNEFFEIIIGSSIVIPAAFVFVGPQKIFEVAQSIFSVVFITMPGFFATIPFGQFFSFLWFMLLFIAALTSSVSILQPAMAFMEDEFDLSRKKATFILLCTTFILSLPSMLFFDHGVVDELDFWGGTMGLIVFALIETILFVWIFGEDRAWDELHQGAKLKIPKIYKFIMKYITPGFLIIILGSWLKQYWGPVILMQSVPAQNYAYILGIRIMLAVMFFVLALAVKVAWKKKKRQVEII